MLCGMIELIQITLWFWVNYEHYRVCVCLRLTNSRASQEAFIVMSVLLGITLLFFSPLYPSVTRESSWKLLYCMNVVSWLYTLAGRDPVKLILTDHDVTATAAHRCWVNAAPAQTADSTRTESSHRTISLLTSLQALKMFAYVSHSWECIVYLNC